MKDEQEILEKIVGLGHPHLTRWRPSDDSTIGLEPLNGGDWTTYDQAAKNIAILRREIIRLRQIELERSADAKHTMEAEAIKLIKQTQSMLHEMNDHLDRQRKRSKGLTITLVNGFNYENIQAEPIKWNKDGQWHHPAIIALPDQYVEVPFSQISLFDGLEFAFWRPGDTDGAADVNGPFDFQKYFEVDAKPGLIETIYPDGEDWFAFSFYDDDDGPGVCFARRKITECNDEQQAKQERDAAGYAADHFWQGKPGIASAPILG